MKSRRTGNRRGLPPDDEVRIVWQCASLLLAYPDPDLPGRLDVVGRASSALPARTAEPLRACVAALSGVPGPSLEAEYVETFDTARRNSLFLTYFAHGDTRKRGAALLRFAQTYRAAGVELEAAELPDHLCVVLEYAATVDLDAGRRLILDHRAGLELLRLSLAESGSRWSGALTAVTAALPALGDNELDAVRRLAAQGPPEEEVGLSPYGEPTADVVLREHRRAVALPMPSVREAVR
jgi:nitrate reductase delta subunit